MGRIRVRLTVVYSVMPWTELNGGQGMGVLIRTFISLLAASLLSLFLTRLAPAQATSSKTLTDELDRLINQRFPETKCPGLSIAVSTEKQIIFSKAIGLADVEQNVLMKPESVQRLGSLSKPISGTIVMSLVDRENWPLTLPSGATCLSSPNHITRS